MCYSEQLVEACRAFESPAGWVLMGWKTFRLEDGERRAVCRTPRPRDEDGPRLIFRIGKLMRDRHGFHLAATREGAYHALLKLLEFDPKTETALQCLRRCRGEATYQYRIFPVLVPARSLGEKNHVHALVVCAGQQPTAPELALAARENQRLADWDVRVARAVAACKRLVAAPAAVAVVTHG